MRVAILGSGVIGVSTAYYLAKGGHEVTVLDRQPEPALETSFANAGQVSPGYSAPWAGPGVPMKAVKWLLSKHSPLVVRPQLDPAQWVFILRMLRNCTAARYEINKSRMMRLANYSREVFQQLRADTGISYDDRTRGTLQLFRTEAQVASAKKDIAVLEQLNVPYEMLGPDGCVEAEPALRLVRDKIAGGLRLPLDETGDCFKFTQSLAKIAENLGAVFRYNTKITGLRAGNGTITAVETENGPEQADAYIVALASYSPQMLRPIGLRLPIYPVKGYSLTIPIDDPEGAPVSTIMDETYKVAVTRLGDRIRVAGTAELTGHDLSLRDARRDTVNHVVSDLFPTGGDPAKAEFWAGLRPMTPDGTPLVGPTPIPNLYLNTGHGTLGWTMSCGSGRLLANVVSGEKPEISLDGLTLDRYAYSQPSAN